MLLHNSIACINTKQATPNFGIVLSCVFLWSIAPKKVEVAFFHANQTIYGRQPLCSVEQGEATQRFNNRI